ncbi:MAG: PH domain-containing protein [Candidatus Levybacteria bacterium]|nr:PH domain-containing protein [Candidatus Levybacteria bacterium]
MTELHKLTLTNLNIRQSIAVLLTKLIFIDVILAIAVIGFYFILVKGEQILPTASSNSSLFLSVFIGFGILKIFLTIYIVLSWLNEYYEITPEHIFHKKGIIFTKTEQYELDKIRMMDIQDNFIGELCNFATITLYDIRLSKYLDMYLIHNPHRYASVLKTLRPHIEIKKDRVRLPFLPKRENDE